MPDGMRLSATLYMPDNPKPDENSRRCLNIFPIARTMPRRPATILSTAGLQHTDTSASASISAALAASEGAPTDREYSEQEQLDGEQVIAWLAAQPWSTGKVGMFGISWGGFNSIQMAMRHPPALKAILAVDATEQLFHDDIHYIDGMMHFDEFELNMDLAPVDDRSARLHAGRKDTWSALRIGALVADVFQASARRRVLARSGAARSAKSRFRAS